MSRWLSKLTNSILEGSRTVEAIGHDQTAIIQVSKHPSIPCVGGKQILKHSVFFVAQSNFRLEHAERQLDIP